MQAAFTSPSWDVLGHVREETTRVALPSLYLVVFVILLALSARLPSARARFFAAASAAAWTAAWLPLVLGASVMVLLWLAVLAAFGIALVAMSRLPRRHLVEAAGVLALALAVRFAVVAAPTNYYTDLFGPSGAPEALVRRHFGMLGLYRALDALIPLRGGAVLGIQRVFGALAIALLFLAQRRASDRGAWSAAATWTAAIWLAIDPLEARLAAGDSAHVSALFVFALGAFLYSFAVDAEGRLAAAARSGALLSALLLGPLRPELLVFPVAWPLLYGRLEGRASIRARLSIDHLDATLALAVLAALAMAPALLDQEAHNAWVLDRLRGFLVGAVDALRPSTIAWVPPAELWLALAGGLLALLARRPRAALLLGLALAILALRIPTQFHRYISNDNLTFARHDILLQVLWITVAASAIGGALSVAREALGTRSAPRLAAAIALFLPLALAAAHAAARFPASYTRLLGFQREFLFLARNLDALDPACALVSVWWRGTDGFDFETGLALPHPLLQFAAPNRPLHLVAPDAPPPRAACAAYYLGATCQLDEQAIIDAPGASAYAARLRDLLAWLHPTCDRLAAARTGALVEEDGPAAANHWPYRNGRLRLGIYPLDAARLGDR